MTVPLDQLIHERVVVIARRSHADEASWDAFAMRCRASFRCAYKAARILLFDVHPWPSIRRLDLFVERDGVERKIGQCALGLTPTLNVFSDTVQLLPEYRALWPHAMRSVAREIGPGKYLYGSHWSMEQSREAELSALPDFRILNVRNFSTLYVNFEKWTSAEAYLADVSANIRRNMRKAHAAYPNHVIDQRGGFDIRRILDTAIIRHQTFRRKRLSRSAVRALARSLMRCVAVARYTNHAFFTAEGRPVSAYCGINFGDDTHYLEGGSLSYNNGASWRLLMAMLLEAWSRSNGRGRFIMGADDDTQKDNRAWQGLALSRRHCRVDALPSSIIEFDYNGAVASEI